MQTLPLLAITPQDGLSAGQPTASLSRPKKPVVNPIQAVSEYFWLIALAVVLLGGLLQAWKAHFLLKNKEQFRKELLPYILSLMFFVGIPFVLMGALLQLEFVTAPEFFEPGGNKWVYLWNFVLLGETLAGLSWIWWFGGAEFLSRYPFLLNARSISAKLVRIVSISIVAFLWGSVLLGILINFVSSR